MNVIEVHWYDAGAGSTLEEAKSHHRVSVGYEVEVTAHVNGGVALSMEKDQLSGVHWIPWPYIERIERIKRNEESHP